MTSICATLIKLKLFWSFLPERLTELAVVVGVTFVVVVVVPGKKIQGLTQFWKVAEIKY